MHVCSAFTVVTDDCHANSFFVIHIAVNSERCHASRAIWVNDEISAYTADVLSDLRTGSVIIAFKAISRITMVTLA